MATTDVLVRRARTSDVPAIKGIVDIYAGSGRKLLAKDLIALYEDVQDFQVAEVDGEVLGCGALHVLWSDLGEVRTVAVDPEHRRGGIGGAVLVALIDTARDLGLTRLFALTFHTEFFERHGFTEIDGTPVDPDTYDALRRSYDPGVAEFLGLEYVKPNTLGNTRMLLKLSHATPRASRVTPESGITVRATEVINVTTADRIDQVGYRAWAAPVVIVDKDYVGQHREPGRRSFSLHRMFYTAQHRER